MENKHEAEKQIQWKLISGTSYFWWDNWLGVGTLVDYSHVERPGNMKVHQFLDNGQWNENMVRFYASPLLVPKILSTQFQFQEGVPDLPIWKPNDNGSFSCSSAWKVIRQKKPTNRINSLIWNKHIPFKTSFFIWRALRTRLPTNEKLSRFGVEPRACVCCRRPGMDTIEHILVEGNFAKHIWKVFAASMGHNHTSMPLKVLLLKWWRIKCKNEVHKLLIQVTPIHICWEFWKHRCTALYEGIQMTISRVIFQITKGLWLLLHTACPYVDWPYSWRDLINLVERCKHDLRVFPVYWIRPSGDVLKLNTDGSALKNQGRIGGGGILRDLDGNMMYAYATPLGYGSNNQAEIQSAVFGIHWCYQHGYRKIILEVDSQLLMNWIKHNYNPPWHLRNFVNELQRMCSNFEYFRCDHVYREANYTADALSKWSHNFDITQHYYFHHQLPKEPRGHFNMDKCNMISFRRQKMKRIKKPP